MISVGRVLSEAKNPTDKAGRVPIPDFLSGRETRQNNWIMFLKDIRAGRNPFLPAEGIGKGFPTPQRIDLRNVTLRGEIT